ncbi:uncharacterized protein BYT42DRAFT_583369 [Radiomyces spectabilis]|uniref:uncharacterized protein n=1 Tax=Radiomyces spectabilis TaxID=64574 RepID=UPI00221EA2A5|nr:uncharacterized protein BYT42DRAFT_583369 [Radiomyces spectabilis]KAI8370692.1 hypothetical protein BYT42DRAFT_583369 [Radiomyces spectabilis]
MYRYSDTSYKRLPQSDPACKVAKIAICGFRDKQVIPSSTTPTEEIASSTTMASPETPTLSPKSTTTINMEDPVEATATVSSLLDNSAPTAAPSRLPSNAPSAHMFDVQGTSYKILTVEKKNATGLKALCKADKGMLGDISFASFQAFQKQMGKVNGVSKVVIGTWNGDMYSLQDNQCLFMTLNFGIVADDCANANAVLCQYNKN